VSTSTEAFSSSHEFYDFVYSAKDTEDEVQRFVAAARDASPDMELGNVCELGIGTGRHAKVLNSLGITVFGVDSSADMIHHLAEAPGIRAELADASNFELGQTFDSVFSFFHVISYQTADEQIEGVFQSARRHLEAGGTFVFDTWYTPGVIHLKPETRVVDISTPGGAARRLSTSHEDVDCSRVDVTQHYTVWDTSGVLSREFSETHRMRHFTSNEIRSLAKRFGFRVSSAVGDTTHAAPTRDDWSALYSLVAI